MDFLKKVVLHPKKVKIEGIDDDVPITRFTLGQWDNEIKPAIQGKNMEEAIPYFINPHPYELKAEDIDAVKNSLTAQQICDIYREGCVANGAIFDSTDEAKKN